MAGINGLTLGFRLGANVRVTKFSVLVKDVADTAQNQIYAGVPAAANAAGILGVTIDHVLEPNFFVPPGTDPSTVTGTTPTLYNLKGRGLTLQVNGVARLYAAGVIAQGDELNVADAFGRVKTVNEAVGTAVFVVGIAQAPAAAVNDIVPVLLSFYVKKT